MTTEIEALELSGQHIGKKVHIALADGPSIIDELIAVHIESRPEPEPFRPDVDIVGSLQVAAMRAHMVTEAQAIGPVEVTVARLWVGVRLKRTLPDRGPKSSGTPMDEYFFVPETQLVEVMD